MVRTYEQVLELDPDNLQALNNTAFALADRFGRVKDAESYAERAHRVGHHLGLTRLEG